MDIAAGAMLSALASPHHTHALGEYHAWHRTAYCYAVSLPGIHYRGPVGSARTIGAALSPLLVGLMFARPRLISLPFFLAGTLKIIYDLGLYQQFVSARVPEEVRQ